VDFHEERQPDLDTLFCKTIEMASSVLNVQGTFKRPQETADVTHEGMVWDAI
jgi:hypothetical protein